MSTPNQSPRQPLLVLPETHRAISTVASCITQQIRTGRRLEDHDMLVDADDQLHELFEEVTERVLAAPNRDLVVSVLDAQELVNLLLTWDADTVLLDEIGPYRHARLADEHRFYDVSWRVDTMGSGRICIRQPDFIEVESYGFDVEEVVEIVEDEYAQDQYDYDYNQDWGAGC